MNKIKTIYSECAHEWESIDYSVPSSVKNSNKLVDRMRSIVSEAESEGKLQELIPLLSEPIPAKWLAHHLIELATVDKATKDKCFDVVEELIKQHEAKGNSANATGERFWLREHKI